MLEVTRFWAAARVITMPPPVAVCVLQVPVKTHMCRCCRTDVGQLGKVFPSEEQMLVSGVRHSPVRRRVGSAVLLRALCTFSISTLQLRGQVHCAFFSLMLRGFNIHIASLTSVCMTYPIYCMPACVYNI